MSTQEIIKAWKDEEYRDGLAADESALLPESPVGLIEVPEDDLEMIAGGCSSYYACRQRCWFTFASSWCLRCAC